MNQAMIFAAGLGTRLKPLTDHIPKAMVEVAGKPLLRRVIERLQAAGFTRLVVNVHHFADQIETYLRENHDFGMDIRISDERALLLDTGGGLKKARALLDPDSPVLIHNVDILSNIDLAAFYHQAELTDCDALLMVSQRQTSRYLLFDTDCRLQGWTNIKTGEVKPAGSSLHPDDYARYAFSGVHVVKPRALKAMDAFPERFSIIDFYLSTLTSLKIKGYVKPDLHLLDVGKLDTLREAENFVRM